MTYSSILVATLVGVSWGACPTVDVQHDLNLTEYTRASWYPQWQQVTKYQAEESLFCVVATYNDTKHGAPQHVPLFKGPVKAVYNHDSQGTVNGTAEGAQLCARVPDEKVPAKLKVAPCFLPNLAAGDYWVLAAGPSPSNYEWAVISGGQPTVQYDDGCTTKEDSNANAGLWLFHRKPVAPSADVVAMKQLLSGMGFTLTRLKPVAQDGCTYDTAAAAAWS